MAEQAPRASSMIGPEIVRRLELIDDLGIGLVTEPVRQFQFADTDAFMMGSGNFLLYFAPDKLGECRRERHVYERFHLLNPTLDLDLQSFFREFDRYEYAVQRSEMVAAGLGDIVPMGSELYEAYQLMSTLVDRSDLTALDVLTDPSIYLIK